jgi:hypothetical protein
MVNRRPGFGHHRTEWDIDELEESADAFDRLISLD